MQLGCVSLSTSSQASCYASLKLRLTDWLTHLLTRVKCRATSVAKKEWNAAEFSSFAVCLFTFFIIVTFALFTFLCPFPLFALFTFFLPFSLFSSLSLSWLASKSTIFILQPPHKIKSARDDEQHQDECNYLFLSEECGLTSRTNCRWRIFTQFLIPTQRSGKTTDATTSQKWVRSLFPWHHFHSALESHRKSPRQQKSLETDLKFCTSLPPSLV